MALKDLFNAQSLNQAFPSRLPGRRQKNCIYQPPSAGIAADPGHGIGDRSSDRYLCGNAGPLLQADRV